MQLISSLQRTIPELKTKTKTLKAETQKELHSLHLGPPIDKNHRHEYLLNVSKSHETYGKNQMFACIHLSTLKEGFVVERRECFLYYWSDLKQEKYC